MAPIITDPGPAPATATTYRVPPALVAQSGNTNGAAPWDGSVTESSERRRGAALVAVGCRRRRRSPSHGSVGGDSDPHGEVRVESVAT